MRYFSCKKMFIMQIGECQSIYRIGVYSLIATSVSFITLESMEETDMVISQLLGELPNIVGESNFDTTLGEAALHARLGQEPEPDGDNELPPDYRLTTPFGGRPDDYASLTLSTILVFILYVF